MAKSSLRLDWCSHQAAKYAVEHWHYSQRMPQCKRVHIGVWEDGEFIGVVIFGTGSGASCNGLRWGLKETFDVAELVRVALASHKAAVSRIVAIAVKMLRQQSPALRMLISYADPGEGHHGGIYQAAGWSYVGRSSNDWYAVDKTGRKHHSRTCSASGVKMQYGRRVQVLRLADAAEIVKTEGKHTYLMPLDAEMRTRIAPLAKPYPKKPCVGSADNGTAAPTAGGGVIPTSTLQCEANGTSETNG